MIPKEIIEYAESRVKHPYMTIWGNTEQRLEEARSEAIKAIEKYREIKSMAIEMAESIKILQDWLKEVKPTPNDAGNNLQKDKE